MINYDNLKVCLMETPETSSVEAEIDRIQKLFEKHDLIKNCIIISFAIFSLIFLALSFAFQSQLTIFMVIFIICVIIIIITAIIHSRLTMERDIAINELNDMLPIAKLNDKIRHEEKIRISEREKLTKQNDKDSAEFEEMLQVAEQVVGQVTEKSKNNLPERPPKNH